MLLLGVVVDDGDEDDDDDGDTDTGSLLETMGPAIFDYTERGGHDSGDTQHSEDEILKDLTDHAADSADFSLMALVFTKPKQIKIGQNR